MENDLITYTYFCHSSSRLLCTIAPGRTCPAAGTAEQTGNLVRTVSTKQILRLDMYELRVESQNDHKKKAQPENTGCA